MGSDASRRAQDAEIEERSGRKGVEWGMVMVLIGTADGEDDGDDEDGEETKTDVNAADAL